MIARSWLWVPGDQPRKVARSRESGADVVVLDLEDAVPPNSKEQGREAVAEALSEGSFEASAVWVRVNAPADGDAWERDLDAVLPGLPAGLVVPKVMTPRHVEEVVRRLSSDEAYAGVALAPIVTEHPVGVSAMAETLAVAADRVPAALWGSEDLSAALGAWRVKDDDGRMLDVFRVVRSLFLLSAATVGVAAVDTPFLHVADYDGLRAESRDAAWQGFAGKQVIHPDHVPIVNDAFTPDESEIRRAIELVQAFEEAGGGGTLLLDGGMVDPPHLVRARRVLQIASALGCT